VGDAAPRVARENGRERHEEGVRGRDGRDRRPQPLREGAFPQPDREPTDREQTEDGVGGGDLRGQEREQDEEAEEDPIAQRASDAGSASSMSITGMSDTIG